MKYFLIIGITFLSGSLFAQKPDLVGKTTEEEIRSEHRVFDIYTDRYTPNSESVAFLSKIEDSVKIYVLFGTWCHDSKKQIPAFMKTLEEADNPLIEVEYIAVTRKKTDPENYYIQWDLKLTPTFVIYRAEQELGRIIEEPTKRLEEDLVEILAVGSTSDQ
ncbi:MAG: hypothetical protein ED557_08895 [Balneola sp.]|nr:MAG: hypothetical protein ED557_08895 [Balneola sp.]